jgi:hypothetical protein
MKRTGNPHAEEQLIQLAAQFDYWRSARTSRAERIPPTLWQQAVALTTVLSLSHVAKCLRVSWSDLRQQCTAAQALPAGAASPAPLHFVDVPPVPAGPFPPPETTIELSRADGACLRILAHEPHLPLVAVIRTFLEPPPCAN